MAANKIHRGDDIVIISRLPTGLTHSDYIDIECSLINNNGTSFAKFNKNGTKEGFSQLIFEADSLNIGVPIDTDATNKLSVGNHFLLIRYVFSDTTFADLDRRQSDTINPFEIVNDSTSTQIGSNIFQIGINGTTKGDDGDSAYQVAVKNGFIGDEASWLLSLNGTDGVDGNDEVNPVGAVLLQKGDLSVNANNIEIDFNSRDQFASNNRVAVSANASITYTNATNAQFATFKVLISNLATITFPTGSISGDARVSSRVFTPTANGNYTISIYKTSTEYEVVISTNPAI